MKIKMLSNFETLTFSSSVILSKNRIGTFGVVGLDVVEDAGDDGICDEAELSLSFSSERGAIDAASFLSTSVLNFSLVV